MGRSDNFTFQPCQGVKTALLIAGKEAVTVQEVGPGHLDGLKGMGAVFPQGLTCASARFDHLVIPAGRGQHRTAHQADLRGALAIEQAVDDAQEEILRPRLCFHATLVAQDVGKYGSVENLMFTPRSAVLS